MKPFLTPAIAGLVLSLALSLVLSLALPGSSIAQSDHVQMTHTGQISHDSGAVEPAASGPTEVGQSAFAAIAEIVEILRRNPETDWSRVDVEGLRMHLMDMDTVTLRAGVAVRVIDGGVEFEVTSPDGAVTGAVRRMTIAHAATMSGIDGMDMQAVEIPHGARLTVTGPNPDMILGLGFIGILTLGMHHQAHHYALASGINPH